MLSVVKVLAQLHGLRCLFDLLIRNCFLTEKIFVKKDLNRGYFDLKGWMFVKIAWGFLSGRSLSVPRKKNWPSGRCTYLTVFNNMARSAYV
jgi:hypothetical protein